MRLRSIGETVTGAVLKMGIKYRGYQDVHYQFMTSGKTYQNKKSIFMWRRDDLGQGSALSIVIDPTDPSDHVFLQ